MNQLQIAEIRRQAMLCSIAHPDKKFFALIKNGTSLAKITDNEELVGIMVGKDNYSIWGIFVNGERQLIRNYTRLSCR